MQETILPIHNRASDQDPPTEEKATRSSIATYLDVPDDELLNHPWKYLGYRVFARWAASEKSFLVVRQFSTLNARIILSLQDDISFLEEKLDLLERYYSQRGPRDYQNGSFRQDSEQARKDILEKIYIALEKYNHFINEYTILQNRPVAPKNDVQSIRTWLRVNHPGAIDEDEIKFLEYEDDLITVRPNPKSPMRRYIESSAWATGYFPKIFRRQPREKMIIDGSTRWYEGEKIEMFASGVISVVGLVMFIVPFWVLDRLGSSLSKLGLITGFVILFYCMVALGTTARPFESLGATAAYAAVLMVFLQASSNTST